MPRFWRRPRGRDRSGETARPADARRATIEHLGEFAHTRAGVEAYVEPQTAEQPVTLILIATTGEWTRRRVPDEQTARRIATDLGLPVYDVRLVGYPRRMRDWNSRQRGH